ncbi:SWI/SNF-related matrix-associated actin-dependent regulator of chromatin subfamily A-like protein 1 [Octopus sinensis]|uniref:SWI/SNF-related matrix-associated actin-dependent regulator of chromatin subfamily A-like protein 1 n=1 Tax=Octopus sinensis TaxID=2607531 RepID=A0A7E6EMJ3_9MOLL|nr:SWI/SNF-related matrix-associated actin-dependent regulator of chromatin subfamily A-like protein 1 [Octopus sinensis]
MSSVYETGLILGIVENLVDIRQDLILQFSKTGFLQWIVGRLQVVLSSDWKKVEFEDNKLYCSEILAIFMQARFVEQEGLQLMNLLIRGKKKSKFSAIKTLSYAMPLLPVWNEDVLCCQQYVQVLGLRCLFPFFMNVVVPSSGPSKAQVVVSSLKNGFIVEGIPFQVVKLLLSRKSKSMEEPLLEDWKRPLHDHLMPFQLESLQYGCDYHGRVFQSRGGRLLIADEMGLGKTLQAIYILAHHVKNVKTIIVCPATVKHTWHVSQWLPFLSLTVVSSKSDRLNGADIVIVNYEMLIRRVNEATQFEFVIVDESHCVKNMSTARSKCVLSITKGAKYVLLLSGTPALSRPVELYPQIYALFPTLFSGFYEFGMRYCAGKKTLWGHDFDGLSNETELRIVLNEIVMLRSCWCDLTRRRLKAEILDQLPSKERFKVDLDVGSPPEELKYSTVVIDGSTTPQNRFLFVDKFQNCLDCRVAILSLTAANTGITLTSSNYLVFAELSWTPGVGPLNDFSDYGTG